MLFPTVEFLVFFVILFLLYWYVFTRKRDRKVLLVLANLVFYYVSGSAFTLLMLALIVISWACVLVLTKIKNYKPRKLFFILATSFHILFLLYFKEGYRFFHWLTGYFPQVFPEWFSASVFASTAIIPIGISYYVFKCCSYMFDVYLGKLSGRNSLLDVVLYVSFFPQIFSGPIVNASFFFERLDNALCADEKNYFFLDFDRASLLILLGFIKKAIVATFLSLLVTTPVFANPQNYNPAILIFAAISYSVVIYADFSGYSDMAIGIGLLLGFETPPNFNRPYVAKNITEFWRRWHISFSRWLQEYVYQAFGGSRFGIVRTLFALFATMIIAGLWHGAKATFIIWGALQGLALCIERVVQYRKDKQKEHLLQEGAVAEKRSSVRFSELSAGEKAPDEKTNEDLPKNNAIGDAGDGRLGVTDSKKTALGVNDAKNRKWTFLCGQIGTFLFVTVSWVFFRAESIEEVRIFFAALTNMSAPLLVVHPFCVILVVLAVGLQYIPKTVTEKMLGAYRHIPLLVKAVLLVLCFLVIKLFTTSGIPEFIYFQF